MRRALWRVTQQKTVVLGLVMILERVSWRIQVTEEAAIQNCKVFG
jgi:hypothetical protein